MSDPLPLPPGSVRRPVETPDGRMLDVVVSGPDGGPTLLFHHGTPGSAIPSRSSLRTAADRGMRVVTYSRPGYGGSDRRPGRRVADVADDVAAILDALGIERVLVGGWSGGGPHALATGALLPDRVDGVLVIAGVAPWPHQGDAAGEPDHHGVAGEPLDWLEGMGEANQVEFAAALDGEAALRTFLDGEAEGLRQVKAADIAAEMRTLLPPVDVACVTDEEGEDMALTFHESLRSGVDGWLDDDMAFINPWGFRLPDISVPVFVWQGDVDLMVPFAHGQWLARALPDATVHLEPGEGHLSIGVGAMGRMLDELLSARGR